MSMHMHSIYHMANAVGLATASVCPAPVAVPNQKASVCDQWPGEQVASIRSNSLRVFSSDFSGSSALIGWSHLNEIRQKFADIRSLEDGWDGVSSVAPKVEVIERASSVLEYALKGLCSFPTPTIVPVADGGVQAEWYTPEFRFELYFDTDGEVAAWSANRETGVEFDAEGRDAVQMLIQWAANLTEEQTFA